MWMMKIGANVHPRMAPKSPRNAGAPAASGHQERLKKSAALTGTITPKQRPKKLCWPLFGNDGSSEPREPQSFHDVAVMTMEILITAMS